MTTEVSAMIENDSDDHVDAEIAECLNLSAPKSFFLFAGAGSGKTRSLIAALQHIQKTSSDALRAKGQRVGVVTYTNAASDEIKRRLLFDPLIDVRTIHSFAWSLIEGLNHDIREWLRVTLAEDLATLRADEAKGRKGTKASATRLASIESKTMRLQKLPHVKRFTYSPTGDNRGRDSLNHSEVLQLTAAFLNQRAAMQSILAGRYPVLLIDESQDTNKHLIDALFSVQAAQGEKFTLGLLGDMMQRIYNDGKDGLGQGLPKGWATPSKRLNHRCPKRVVSLINKVRRAVDKQHQEPRSDAAEGFVRLYIVPGDEPKKGAAEVAIAAHMAKVSADSQWSVPTSVKTLTLEHRMAATRMGFLEIFSPLYDYKGWSTSFLDGSLPATRFFSEEVLPLVESKCVGDRFAVARILKTRSPLMTAAALKQAADQQQHLVDVNASVEELLELWAGEADPTLLQVLRRVAKTNLFEIPDSLRANASDAMKDAAPEKDDDEPQDRQSERALAIEAFLTAPFSQVAPLAQYLRGDAPFDTHQGVKGLEFDRVMVIMDDIDAKGFLFKYEDLFGGKAAGDKTLEGTKRLFYVTCSRARKSLALVAYTRDPQRIRNYVLSEGWFTANEIIVGIPKAD
jgi:DNA helicase-2/ATP-dependent DNA helicase PcrA